MKKHSFLLLELMIAFALVSLFASPLIFNPMQKLSRELTTLEAMECERLSELYFSEIKERLYKNDIPFKKIAEKIKEERTFFIFLGPFKKKRRIHFETTLYWQKAPAEDRQGRLVGLLACDIVFKKTLYAHNLFVYAYPTEAQ